MFLWKVFWSQELSIGVEVNQRRGSLEGLLSPNVNRRPGLLLGIPNNILNSKAQLDVPKLLSEIMHKLQDKNQRFIQGRRVRTRAPVHFKINIWIKRYHFMQSCSMKVTLVTILIEWFNHKIYYNFTFIIFNKFIVHFKNSKSIVTV